MATINPICPYCEKELSIDDFLPDGKGLIEKGVKAKKMKWGFFGVHVTSMCFCPYCGKVLSIARSAIQFT